MVFPAKRDWCLQTVLHFSMLGLCGSLLAAGFGYYLHDPSIINLILLAQWSIYAVMYLVRFFFTWYEVTEKELIVREGFFRVIVALDRIIEVVPARGGYIGAGSSPDSLKVRFIRAKTTVDSLIISPRYKAGFLSELAARSPALQPAGEGLKAVEMGGLA